MESEHEIDKSTPQGVPPDAGSNGHAIIGWLLGELPSPANKAQECDATRERAAYGYAEDAVIPADVARRLQLADALKPLPGKPGVWSVPVEQIVHGLILEASGRGITEPTQLEVYVSRGLADCGSDVDPDDVPHLIEQSTADQKPVQPPAVSRRGRGRPRDEEFDKYTFDRFIVLRSAARVAEEAANQFGGTADAALKRIKREPWYQSMAPAVAIPKHKPTPSPQPADGSKRVPICQSRRKREPASRPMGTTSQAPGGSTDSQRPKELGGAAHDQQLGDAIEKHIRVHGPREPEQFVSELGLALLDVVGALQHQARFRCLPGNRYGLR